LNPLLSTLRVVVVIACFAAACGTSPVIFPLPDAGKSDAGPPTKEDGGVTTDGGLALAEACATLNASRCQYLVRCGLLEASAESREACARAFEATWCGPLTWPSHVAAGALRYDPVKAQACAQAFSTQACAEWSVLPDSCTGFLKPRVQLGQPCFDGFVECADGVCRGNFCPRTCQPRALLDEACISDGDCRSGLYCRFPTFMSSVGTCTNYSGVGGSCEGNNRCQAGLRCVNLQCRSLPTLGQPCLDGVCGEQTYCDVLAADGGVCVTRKSEAARCDGDECQHELVCEPTTQSCAKLKLSIGDPCTAVQECPTGSICLGLSSGPSGTCEAPLPVGATCRSAGECEAHLACLEADGGFTCQIRASTGSPCKSSTDCRASALCQQGACVELPLPGQSCADTRVCRWGLCRDVTGLDGGAECGALLSAGQTCVRGEQCASGSCDKGVCLARCAP